MKISLKKVSPLTFSYITPKIIFIYPAIRRALFYLWLYKFGKKNHVFKTKR